MAFRGIEAIPVDVQDYDCVRPCRHPYCWLAGKSGDKASLIRPQINNKRFEQDSLRREKEGYVFEHSRVITEIERFQAGG